MDDAFVRELLADHSRNPRNHGSIADPDVDARTENPQCVGPTHPEGDRVRVTATLSDEDPPVVEAVRFTGRGCTLSQATASLLSERMSGTPVPEVTEWDGETLEETVGMVLTPSRLKCAELLLVAFRTGVEALESDEAAADDDGRSP
jgi:nitrogen fixation NifU-like protein